MDRRDRMVAEIHEILEKAGFMSSEPGALAHAGFDLVAKRGNIILVLKACVNAGQVSGASVRSMLALAHSVDGTAMLISGRSGGDTLEDGVMYTRSGMPLLTPGTFRDLLVEGVPPLVYAASGGFYVQVDSDVIRQARDRGLTLGDLADMAGVSRRTILMYQEGMSAKLDVAMRLEEGLGTELIVPVDPMSRKVESVDGDEGQAEPDELARNIFMKLHMIGYSVRPTSRCPFDAVAEDRSFVMLTGVDRKRPGLDRRARMISNLSRILERHSVMFIDGRGRVENIEGIPVIGCKEMERIESKKHIVELIEERS